VSLRTLLAVGAAIVLAACENNAVSPSDIVGETWRLASLQEGGSAPVIIEDSARYSLRLAEDGRLAVMSDCNSCGGSYSLTGSSIDLGPLTCTKVFCGDQSLDSRFTAALEAAQTVAPDDGELTIQGGDVTLRFRN